MHASPLLSPLRLDEFVSEQVTPVEHTAQQAVTQSAFDSFVNTPFTQVEKIVQTSLLAKSFAEYVSTMEKAGFKATPEDDAMTPERVTSASRIASQIDDSPEIGSLGQRCLCTPRKKANALVLPFICFSENA